MSHIDEIRRRIRLLKPTKSLFAVSVGSYSSSLKFKTMCEKPHPADNLMDAIIQSSYTEKWNGIDSGYTVCTDTTYGYVMNQYITRLHNAYFKVCPAKRPKATKFYKEWDSFIQQAIRNDDYHDTVISLVNYHEENIEDMKPDQPHGKNMYKLLQAITKKYRR